MNKAIAELIGTFIFTLFVLGAYVLGGMQAGLNLALAAAFVVVAVIVLIGAVSGAHINPAVTLGSVLTGRTAVQDAVQYWIAQFVGAIAGAAVLKLVLEVSDLDLPGEAGLGGNLISEELGTTGVFIIEALVVALFVLVFLKVTDGKSVVGSALTIGLTFGAVYLIAGLVTGGSANMAKSLGAAIFEGGDTDSLADVWLFIVAGAVGAVIAALVLPLLRSEESVEARETVAG